MHPLGDIRHQNKEVPLRVKKHNLCGLEIECQLAHNRLEFQHHQFHQTRRLQCKTQHQKPRRHRVRIFVIYPFRQNNSGLQHRLN